MTSLQRGRKSQLFLSGACTIDIVFLSARYHHLIALLHGYCLSPAPASPPEGCIETTRQRQVGQASHTSAAASAASTTPRAVPDPACRRAIDCPEFRDAIRITDISPSLELRILSRYFPRYFPVSMLPFCESHCIVLRYVAAAPQRHR